MREQNGYFSILDTVDSTNNYAMARVQEGLAKHGQAWFAKDQFAGKGQRGKKWLSRPGENIIMSVAVKPREAFSAKPFLLSALAAVICRDFFSSLAGSEAHIKWPNDLYWRDRKTGGLLIENRYAGQTWAMAVVGIGININQRHFDDEVVRATSLGLITGRIHDPVVLAQELRQKLMAACDGANAPELHNILDEYNHRLYKRYETVLLKKGPVVFETEIRYVDEYGRLHTRDSTEKIFEHGEVELIPGRL